MTSFVIVVSLEGTTALASAAAIDPSVTGAALHATSATPADIPHDKCNERLTVIEISFQAPQQGKLPARRSATSLHLPGADHRVIGRCQCLLDMQRRSRYRDRAIRLT